jgi:hypothetical protein
MNPDLSTPVRWSTVAFSDIAGTCAAEPDGLCQHMQQCSKAYSRARDLGQQLDALHRGMAGRFVTSLTLFAALLGATLMVW